MLKLFLTSDHITPATGKTVAITISKNGGAFANPNAGATNATEVSNGWYKVTLDATDSNTEGDLVVRGTATSCDDTERVFRVHLPPNFALASIDGSGRVDVSKVAGTAQTAGDLAALITAVDDLIDTEVAAIKADTAAILLDTGTDGVVVANIATGAVSAAALASDAANEIADALLDRADAIETGETPRMALRHTVAAVAGVLSGAATTTVSIKGAGVATTRITATVDADGNRSAVTLA